MRSRLISRTFLPAALLLTTFPTLAHAAVQDRIASAVNSGSRVPLTGTVSSRAKHSADLGQAPSNQKLDALSLRFSMTAAQQADLTQFSAAQLTPGSTQYHQWLTPEQYGARFGLSSGDLAKVSAWLTSQGFTINSVARSSTFITFSGTVAQAQQAFSTTIHKISYNGEQHISNLTEPVLPSAVANVVTGLTGLNDFKAKPHSRPRSLTPEQALYTQTINGTTSHYIVPADLYTIYEYPPSSSTITGTGITIAVMGQTEIVPADITAFQTAAGLPSKAPTQQYVATTNFPTPASLGVSAGDVDEAHLDNEWSNASAPGASILYVYGPDVFAQSLTYAIDNNLAHIITISYGACESVFGASSINLYNQMFQQANVEGITIISSAGDTGATDCDAVGLASEGLAVDFPGSSPYVISAGGSMFSGDVSTPGTYWSSANSTTGSNSGSALSYIPEQPWNETTATAGLGDGVTSSFGSGGGGASVFFGKPSWQQGTGMGATPADGARDVPDFSLNAAAIHDGYIVCTSGSGTNDLPCTTGFLTSSGQPNVFGGTSFVAPTFAGILARVEQQLGSAAAGGLGNIGPTLYGLANGPTYGMIFNDITTGNNSVPCSQGTLNCPNGGAIGFNAGTGYDQASGLGSLNVANLISNWSSATPTGIGGGTTACNPTTPTTGTASCITTTSLTTTATALCGVSGTVSLTATVAGMISGTAPTGTVQFLVDNAVVGTATLSSGVATYNLVTSSLTSGGHTVSAAYLGDPNYSGSKGTLFQGAGQSPVLNGQATYPNGAIASLDVVSSTKPDFSLTPCTAPISVNPSATAPGVSFTVTPFNGFTGPVNLTVTNNEGMAATTSFSVTPVNITTSAGVATSFVITASETSTAANASLKAKPQPSGRLPWYAAGSGATLGCLLLIALPRRRRWGALLAAVISIAAFTAVGCSNTSNTGGAGGGTPTNPGQTVTPAVAGTYSFVITAVSGSLVHSTFVTVTVP
jgi:subtilase family serine protease